MPNYKEVTTTGDVMSWVRASKIIIDNPYNGTPSIRFVEEEKVLLPTSDVINRDISLAPVMDALSDPNKVITLLHPETGAVIGSTTYQNVYIILFSLYKQLADARDLAELPPEEPPV